MLDFLRYFDVFCEGTGLCLTLTLEMPAGYDQANGLFDPEKNVVFFNVQRLASRPDYEQAFYFFHELRHAAQYLRPESFPASIRRSLSYILQYDGTCYKWINGRCLKCSFADSAAEFPDLYLGQPYERDANEFAYHRVLDILGFSEGLQRLYRFWMPSRPVPEGRYDAVYAAIDEKLGF